jgi:Mrp family chromosome partitioning ATPase
MNEEERKTKNDFEFFFKTRYSIDLAVALADVRKEIVFCRKLELPIVGLVENMSGYVCQHCAQCTNIFSSDGGRLLAEELSLPFVGCIPSSLFVY